MQQPIELLCPICGMDGFDDEGDLDIHLEDCEEEALEALEREELEQ